MKLHGEVGIGLDLIYERLSSRLRIQIRCSTLVINPEMKIIKIKDLFVSNNIVDSPSLEQVSDGINVSEQNRYMHLIGLTFYDLDNEINYRIVNVQDGSTCIIVEYDLIEDLDVGDHFEMELSRVLHFIESQY